MDTGREGKERKGEMECWRERKEGMERKGEREKGRDRGQGWMKRGTESEKWREGSSEGEEGNRKGGRQRQGVVINYALIHLL